MWIETTSWKWFQSVFKSCISCDLWLFTRLKSHSVSIWIGWKSDFVCQSEQGLNVCCKVHLIYLLRHTCWGEEWWLHSSWGMNHIGKLQGWCEVERFCFCENKTKEECSPLVAWQVNHFLIIWNKIIKVLLCYHLPWFHEIFLRALWKLCPVWHHD